MLGWFADFFRLIWGLPYWNTRKAWFRRQRGRTNHPCQSPSDSGRAFETGCEACLTWNQPARFRRICPRLVGTPQGLRCSVDAADVAPFWGRMVAYYGGALLAVYVSGVIAVFAFLRTIGYPVSVVHVAWPGLWHRVPQARGWFFANKSQRALAEGRTAEGLLYLSNAHQFDPSNYQIALDLARTYQSGPIRESDLLFEALLRDHPAERETTAQEWFRALLARGDFRKIAALAEARINADSVQAHTWLRALLFATRQLGDDARLQTLATGSSPGAVRWRSVVKAELLVRAGETREARAMLRQAWPAPAPSFTVYYRVATLISLGDFYGALDTLEANRSTLADDEAYLSLRLDALAAAGAARTLQADLEELLAPRLTPARVILLCVFLIRHPNAEFFGRLVEKAQRDQMPFDEKTARAWFSLFCTAGAVGDTPRLHSLSATLKLGARTQFVALDAIESFFRSNRPGESITSHLPSIPLPVEVDYALLARYLLPEKGPASRPLDHLRKN